MLALGNDLAGARVVDSGISFTTRPDTIRISVQTRAGVLNLQVGQYHEYLKQYYLIVDDQRQLLVPGRSVELAGKPLSEFKQQELLAPASNNNSEPTAAVLE